MNSIFKESLRDFKFSNDLCEDSYNLLMYYNCKVVAEHSKRVAEECKRLAKRFKYDEKVAEIAGLLHDISAIYPNSRKVEVSRDLGIEILEEEEEFPLILHQKVSRVMAKKIFKIENEEVLSAIGCHTTLKKNPSKLDLILFVADKIQWDQNHTPPYIEELQQGLNVSLEHGAYAYIRNLINDKENLKVIHPWLQEAHEELSLKVNDSSKG